MVLNSMGIIPADATSKTTKNLILNSFGVFSFGNWAGFGQVLIWNDLLLKKYLFFGKSGSGIFQ
jgi:hypothetical protein